MFAIQCLISSICSPLRTCEHINTQTYRHLDVYGGTANNGGPGPGTGCDGPLHALVSLCSGVMWVFILFLAAALKNAHCDFLLTEALSSTQVFLWILKTLFLSQFFFLPTLCLSMLKLLCNVLLGAILGAVRMVYLKLARYVTGLPESMGSSLNDCEKNPTLCTLCCVEMRI